MIFVVQYYSFSLRPDRAKVRASMLYINEETFDSAVILVGSWWRHQMETFSALLPICAENSPVPGEFPAQRPVTRSSDFFFDMRLNTRLSKQS